MAIIVRANNLFYIYIYTHTDHIEPLSITGGKYSEHTVQKLPVKSGGI
jgi:hypothetical protein